MTGERRNDSLPAPMVWIAFGVVLAVAGSYLVFTLANASYTLGCDYLAYDGAARRWLAGQPPYDAIVAAAGQCGTFQYPPPFLALIAPLTLLPSTGATWAFIAFSVACVLAAFALMPVPREVKLIVLALAGTSWPLLFAIKVGAVGPLLMLVFAAAWRWRDRPGILGLTVAVGSLVKLQPALLLVWMVLTRRLRATVVAVAGIAVAAALAYILDPLVWGAFVNVLRQVSAGVLTVGANFAPASIAYFMGTGESTAQLVGIAHTAAVLGLVVLAALRCESEPSLLVAAVASQVVSPVMWDHYAVVLFLPMAWLLARRQWWVLVIGVALNAMFVQVITPAMYVVAIDATLIGLVWAGWRRPGDAVAQEGAPALTPTGFAQ